MSTAQDRDTCAMCARFTLKGYEQQAQAGQGYCTGYERMTQWDGISVLFVRALNHEIAARKSFVEKQATKDASCSRVTETTV